MDLGVGVLCGERSAAVVGDHLAFGHLHFVVLTVFAGNAVNIVHGGVRVTYFEVLIYLNTHVTQPIITRTS